MKGVSAGHRFSKEPAGWKPGKGAPRTLNDRIAELEEEYGEIWQTDTPDTFVWAGGGPELETLRPEDLIQAGLSFSETTGLGLDKLHPRCLPLAAFVS